MPKVPKGSIKNIIMDTILIVIATLSLIFFLEIIARQLYQEEDSGSCFQNDEVLFYKPKANCSRKEKFFEGKTFSHYFNECGYISKHKCSKKTAGTLRIVGIGDSFTEGVNVNDDESYLSILESILQNKLTDYKIEMFNLGVRGYDLPQYRNRLFEALKLKPDILTIAILANDFYIDLSPEAINRQKKISKKWVVL
jgi:hypothetical protein